MREIGNLLKDESNISILNELLGGDLLSTTNLASLVQDFVPTIRNSQTTCVPCGGAVRAQCPSDSLTVRGMAGGYVGHSVGGQIWGNSDDTWKSENDAIGLNGEMVYWDPIEKTKPNYTIGHYVGPQRENAAIRIRSVYGAEYAGGYCGLMECGSTAQTGGLSLLGGLVHTENLLGALQAVYPVIRNAAVYGPLAQLDVNTWNSWVQYIGQNGGFASELSRIGIIHSQEELDAILATFIYGYHVVAGRDQFEIAATKILSGCAGGFVGSMHSGVIRNGHAEDVKLIRAMRAAGGFAGEMQTKGLAELGSVSLLGIDLQLGNLLQAGSVFVPAVYASGATGYQMGVSVSAFGDGEHDDVGCAGGFVGASYGGQIGEKQDDGVSEPDVWIRNLKDVKGVYAIGGFVGKAAAASVLSADTGDVSTGYLQEILNFVNSNPSKLINLLNASVGTIKNAEVTASDPDWGIVIDGKYTEGGETKYADYAGGFAGSLEATVLGERKNADDKLVLNNLRSVSGGYYVGGFFGLAKTGSVAEVGGNNGAGTKTKLLQLIQLGNVSVLDAFRTYIYHAEVNGVADGICVEAHDQSAVGRMETYRVSGAAGGFGGGLMNGTVENSAVVGVNSVKAPNYAAGFIGYMGKGGGVDAEEVSIEQEHQGLITQILNALGLDLGVNAQVLNIVGSTVEHCSAAGYEPGFVVKTTETQHTIQNLVNDADLTGSCAAGFTGFGDISQIEDCHVTVMKFAKGPQISAGFIGRTSVAYLGNINAESPLVQFVVRIVDVLVRALYLDNLQDADVLNLDGNLLGLKLFADGNLLYVNLLGLKVGVSLSRNDPDYGGNSDAAIITIGSSTIKLPCDENGITNTGDTPNAVVHLIQSNRTSVKNSSVTGIDRGYDIFAGGSWNGVEGMDSFGYAGGFVGYNDLGFVSHDNMILCDEIFGVDGLVGPFAGKTAYDANYTPDYLEHHDNVYSVYRGRESGLTEIQTDDGTTFGSAVEDNTPGGPYNRYDVTHRDVIMTHADLENAVETGSNQRDLNAYASGAKVILMLNEPLEDNKPGETPDPDDMKDPCDEYFELTVKKTWKDDSDFYGGRPGAITVRIWQVDVGTASPDTMVTHGIPADETLEPYQIITLTVDDAADDNVWSKTVKDLPVWYMVELTTEENEEQITTTERHYYRYYVCEDAVEHYSTSYQVIEKTATVQITNEHVGPILPETGRAGDVGIVVIGVSLLMIGGLWPKRRRARRKEVPMRN